jgi:hypothetical protein
VSVRSAFTDRLDNLSSLAGGNHEQGCSCHLEGCPKEHSSKEGGFSNPPLFFRCATTCARVVTITRSADVSVRGDLTDRLENLSSLTEGNHEQGCSCHLEGCLHAHSSREGGFSNPPLSFRCATTCSRVVIITRSADVSVRGALTDRLDNLSSLTERNHEQGCSCHLEDCPK